MTEQYSLPIYEPKLLEGEPSILRPEVFAAWIVQLQEMIKNYNGSKKEDYDNLMAAIKTYKEKLQEKLPKDKQIDGSESEMEVLRYALGQELSQNQQMLAQRLNYPYIDGDNRQMHLAENNVPILPGDFEKLINSRLKELAAQATTTEELCNNFGIKYNETKGTFFPPQTGIHIRKSEGKGGKFEKAKKKDKLAELLPFLVECGIYGQDMHIIKSTLQQGQMREVPYVLIDIPKIDKQIFICDQMHEGVYISPTRKDVKIFEELDKKQGAERESLVLVKNGDDWLKKLKGELFSESSQRRGNKKDRMYDSIRGEGDPAIKLRSRFPTSGDFLRYLISLDSKKSLEISHWARVVLQNKDEASGTYKQALEVAKKIYGEDQNILHAEKVENRDAEYIKDIMLHGLPEGVNYFLPQNKEERELEQSVGRFSGCPTALDFVKRYLSFGFDPTRIRNLIFADINTPLMSFCDILIPSTSGPDLVQEKDVSSMVGKDSAGKRTHHEYVTYRKFLQAAFGLYPNSPQLEYLRDIKDREKIIAMLKGEYNFQNDGLNGICGIVEKRQDDGRSKVPEVVELKPEAFPTFEDFWHKVIIPQQSSKYNVSKKLNAMYGFGTDYLCERLGCPIPRDDHRIENLYKALKIVYPESQQLEYLIALNSQGSLIKIIKGEVRPEHLRYYEIVRSPSVSKTSSIKNLEYIPCPTLNDFLRNYGIQSKLGTRNVGKKLVPSIGIGIKRLAKTMGVKLVNNKEVSYIELLEILKKVYPESEEQLNRMLEEANKV